MATNRVFLKMGWWVSMSGGGLFASEGRMMSKGNQSGIFWDLYTFLLGLCSALTHTDECLICVSTCGLRRQRWALGRWRKEPTCARGIGGGRRWAWGLAGVGVHEV